MGVHKGGTSWLYHILSKHPGIDLAQRDTHFFSKDLEYKNGIETYISRSAKTPISKLWIEMSNDYLYSKEAIERIALHFPKTKLFVSLRNPYERAYSHYLQDLKTGLLDQSISFENAMKMDSDYTEKGQYKNQILRLFDHFDKSQIHFIIFDDIQTQAQALTSKLFAFLDLEALEIPQSELQSKINAARMPINKSLEQLQNKMYYSLRSKKTTQALWWVLKKMNAGKIIRKFNTSKTMLDPPDIKVFRNHFEEDIAYVKELLGREDLNW